MKFIEDPKMLSSTFVFKAESKPLEYVSSECMPFVCDIATSCTFNLKKNRNLKYEAVTLVSQLT